MFESLSDRLSGVFDRLRGRGALNEADVRGAMREVRIALLEADVALPVVREFVDRATEQAVGQQVLRSVTPGQQVVKIVHDALVEMLGAEEAGLDLAVTPPAVIMMVGLQGSGKTTTTAKLAKRLTEKDRKKVLMASLDVARPAAQEQLAVLGRQAEVATLPIVPGQGPVDIARRALNAARLQGYDVLMLDTAGRLHVDQALMDEMKAVAEVSRPQEVPARRRRDDRPGRGQRRQELHRPGRLTGVILTRMDGDARGGAALSMRAVTGKPIKFAGTGEAIDTLEAFHPERVAGRILGMGDVVSLVERAQETIKADEAEALARKMAKGQFDLNDLRGQLQQMQRMGGLGALAGMMPGLGKMKNQINESGVLEGNVLGRLDAIISSMTPKERAKPELMNAKRKIRVAKGSGTTVQEVNKLLKMHQEMANAMKKIRKMGGLGKLGALFGGGGMGGLGGAGGGGAAAPAAAPGSAAAKAVNLPPGFPGNFKKNNFNIISERTN